MVDKEYNVVVGVEQFGETTITYLGVLVEVTVDYDVVRYNVMKFSRSYDTLKDALEAIDEEVGGENG